MNDCSQLANSCSARLCSAAGLVLNDLQITNVIAAARVTHVRPSSSSFKGRTTPHSRSTLLRLWELSSAAGSAVYDLQTESVHDAGRESYAPALSSSFKWRMIESVRSASSCSLGTVVSDRSCRNRSPSRECLCGFQSTLCAAIS